MPTPEQRELVSFLPREAVGVPEELSSLGQSALQAITNSDSLQRSPCPSELVHTKGNRLRDTFIDGPEIYEGFRKEIARAQHAVYVAFYRWDAGSRCAAQIGAGLQQATSQSRGRPVLVRLLVSDIMVPGVDGRPIDDLYDSVKAWGIPSDRALIQLATYPHTLRGSLHDKMIIVDCFSLLLTGANPELKHDDPRTCWRDTGYVLTGAVALAAAASFDEAWIAHAKHWSCRGRLGRDCRETRHAPVRRRWLSHNSYTNGSLAILAAGKLAGDVQDSRRPNNPQNQAWLSVIKAAKKSINIISPNLDASALHGPLTEALERRVRVRILSGKGFNDAAVELTADTNETVVEKLRRMVARLPASAQRYFSVHWFSRDGQVPIFGNGNGACHTKYFSVDSQVSIIGSGNLDEQSWQWSREFNVLIDDNAETLRLDALIFEPEWELSVRAWGRPEDEMFEISEAWVELYDDKRLRDRVLRIKYPKNVRDMNRAVTTNGKRGFGDKTSSARWRIPRGWKLVLYDDKGFKDSPFPLLGTGLIEENRDLGSFSDKTSSARWERV